MPATGYRERRGWAGDGGEGAKFWLAVLTEIKNRGVADVCIAVCDGLKGLPEAINTVSAFENLLVRARPHPREQSSSPSARELQNCGRNEHVGIQLIVGSNSGIPNTAHEQLAVNPPGFRAHPVICFQPVARRGVHSSRLRTRLVVCGRAGASAGTRCTRPPSPQ
jgi:hypothetical protein